MLLPRNHSSLARLRIRYCHAILRHSGGCACVTATQPCLAREAARVLLPYCHDRGNLSMARGPAMNAGQAGAAREGAVRTLPCPPPLSTVGGTPPRSTAHLHEAEEGLVNHGDEHTIDQEALGPAGAGGSEHSAEGSISAATARAHPTQSKVHGPRAAVLEATWQSPTLARPGAMPPLSPRGGHSRATTCNHFLPHPLGRTNLVDTCAKDLPSKSA